jgi:hypothetical protein
MSSGMLDARAFSQRHGFVPVGTSDGRNEENAPDIHFQGSVGSAHRRTY